MHAPFLISLDIDHNDAKCIAEWNGRTVAQAVQLLVAIGLPWAWDSRSVVRAWL